MSTITTGILENALPQKWLPVKAVIVKENRISIDSYYKPEEGKPMQPSLITWTNVGFISVAQLEGASYHLNWASVLEANQPVSDKSMLKSVHSWL